MKPQNDEEEQFQRNSPGYTSLIPELYDGLEFHEENLWIFKDFASGAFQTQMFGSPYTVDDNEVTPSSNIY